MNGSPSKVGLQTGKWAGEALDRLGGVGWNLLPTGTLYFNKAPSRYVYTSMYGWVDMVHFVFYAGRAHRAKVGGSKNPQGDAVQEGHQQEAADSLIAPWSYYSYEDLPSDQLGAVFGAFVFDPSTKETLGQQIENWILTLGATSPKMAPNFSELPGVASKNPPTNVNGTTNPKFTRPVSGDAIEEGRRRACAIGNKAACGDN